MNKLILSLFFLTTCGCSNMVPFSYHINPDFMPYVKVFESISGIPVHIDIMYSDLTAKGWAGECAKYSSGYREILIDRATWNLLGSPGKEEEILHELGHCILNRDHDNFFTVIGTDTIPESIMYFQVFGDWNYYTDNRDYYLRELIHGR